MFNEHKEKNNRMEMKKKKKRRKNPYRMKSENEKL